MSEIVSSSDDMNRERGFYWILLNIKTTLNPDSQNPQEIVEKEKMVAEWFPDNQCWFLPGMPGEMKNGTYDHPIKGSMVFSFEVISNRLKNPED